MAILSMDSIGRLLAGDGLNAVSKRARCSEAKTAKVLSLGIPTLIAGMKKNVSTPEGDASLSKALWDHSGKNTGNVRGFLEKADLTDGKKILGHVLGDKQDATVEQLSKASGLSGGTVVKILALVAPLLLTLLGNQQSQTAQQSAVQPITAAQPAQQQSSGLGGLLGGLLGGGGQSGGGFNPASLLLGALTSGGSEPAQPAQPAQEEQSSGLLSGFLNLFR